MKKIYHLSTCSTCKRIIKDLGIGEEFEYQDIKNEAITPEQLEQMKEMAGSYEALFSRTARKYRELNLKEKQLTEEEYKKYILDEYTFLKRPVTIIGDDIFVGNSKKTVAAIQEKLA